MKQPHHQAAGAPGSTISLKQLVNNLVSNSKPVANCNKTYIVNDVKAAIILPSTLVRAISVITDLLTIVVSNSRNGDIHITAERSEDVIIFEIQERNNYNGYALAFSIGSMEPVASSLGGHITIKGPQRKVTTVSFIFPDQLAA